MDDRQTTWSDQFDFLQVSCVCYTWLPWRLISMQKKEHWCFMILYYWWAVARWRCAQQKRFIWIKYELSLNFGSNLFENSTARILFDFMSVVRAGCSWISDDYWLGWQDLIHLWQRLWLSGKLSGMSVCLPVCLSLCLVEYNCNWSTKLVGPLMDTE